MRGIYIGVVECSPVVMQKITAKHGVTLDEVREAVQWPARPERMRWLDDERGPRLAVEARTATGRWLRAVLYPVDETDGTWRLGTAVPLA